MDRQLTGECPAASPWLTQSINSHASQLGLHKTMVGTYLLGTCLCIGPKTFTWPWSGCSPVHLCVDRPQSGLFPLPPLPLLDVLQMAGSVHGVAVGCADTHHHAHQEQPISGRSQLPPSPGHLIMPKEIPSKSLTTLNHQNEIENNDTETGNIQSAYQF